MSPAFRRPFVQGDVGDRADDGDVRRGPHDVGEAIAELERQHGHLDGEDGRATEVLGEEQGGASVSDCEGFVWLSQDGVSRFVKEPDPSVHSVWQRESVDVELGGEARTMRESRGYCVQKRAEYPLKHYRRGFCLNFS